MVRAGLCKNPVRTYDVGGPSSITISLPGSDPADAERRRYVPKYTTLSLLHLRRQSNYILHSIFLSHDNFRNILLNVKKIEKMFPYIIDQFFVGSFQYK